MKTGFIGCGNMGGALIRAAANSVNPGDIFITDICAEKAAALAVETGTRAVTAAELAAVCDFIFLGVKPQNMRETLAGLSLPQDRRVVLVTMAAGLTMDTILSYANSTYPIIRIMPNLAAAVGEGMLLWCSKGTNATENAYFETLMSHAGRLMPIDESKIDAASAISGCGPAFVCLFAEALADGGVLCGLKRADAQLLAEQMLLGTAKLLIESGRHPGDLKDAVCSPGGTTIAGVLRLEEGAFRSDVAQAVIAAYEKTLKLK